MAILAHCTVYIVFLSTTLLYIHALSINSLYVIVDPISSSSTLAIQIKDHYTSSKQRIGNMNTLLMDVYVKQKGSNSWLRMTETDDYYILYSNDTLSAPMSLRVTFVDEPYANYSWNSFLSNLAGTTIYHLYIEKKNPSTTDISHTTTDTTLLPTQIATRDTEITSTDATLWSTSNTLDSTYANNEDDYLPQHQSHDNIFTFDELVFSLVLVSVLCVIVFVCLVTICCCCYFYIHKRIQSVTKPNNQTRGSVILSMAQRPKKQFSKMNMIPHDMEGMNESPETYINEMDSNDDDALFQNISSKLRKVANISLRKLSRSHSYNDHEQNPIIISTESKSRTSVSLYSAQPGVEHNASHTYSLSMDQLLQLQHGRSVETENGIRIKLKHGQKHETSSDTNTRNRVLSLIKTYDTQGYSPINRVDIHGLSNDDLDEESSSSNESLYNYQHNENEEQTDGAITTPTNTSNVNCEIRNIDDIDQLASLPPEEGVISNTE